MMRDCRINLIFEGSSEIMHLFMAREAVDKHLAGRRRDDRSRRTSAGEKLAALPRILGVLRRAGTRRSGCGARRRRPRYGEFGPLAPHLRFVERSARKLARESFHGMAVYQAKMERKQGFLFRCVDVVDGAVRDVGDARRARAACATSAHPEAAQAPSSSPISSAATRAARCAGSSATSGATTTRCKNQVAASVMGGRHAWLERGILELGLARRRVPAAPVHAARSRRARASRLRRRGA